jgi:hypothetical protein
MVLTDNDRRRFIEYLSQSIESTRLIIGQLEKLPSAKIVLHKEKMEMAAEIVVLAKLVSMESMSLVASDHP